MAENFEIISIIDRQLTFVFMSPNVQDKDAFLSNIVQYGIPNDRSYKRALCHDCLTGSEKNL